MDSRPEVYAFGGVVATYLLVRNLLRKTIPSQPLNFEDKTLKSSIRQKFSSKKVPSNIDTIIIGAGMGGLSCAAVLARLNKRVLVLEQHNDVAGGSTHQFDLEGYRFDSGLHYTVPWSVPIFALTCGKRESDVCQFSLMGDSDMTADKIYLSNLEEREKKRGKENQKAPNIQSFDMKYHEGHLERLYTEYPAEREAINNYIHISNRAMNFVKIFLAFRLFPKYIQHFLWNFVPNSIIQTVAETAEQILPKLTQNKRLISLLSSMWIDTGARPDEASFMLTASVFRGIAMEGACYPVDGSEAMAIELTNTITSHGGSLLIRAQVQEIVYNEEGTHVIGVRVKRSVPNSQPIHFQSILKRIENQEEESVFIPCKRVVSGAGYSATFDRLVPERILTKYQVPRRLDVPQSAGFVMANIGFKDINPEDVGIANQNTWHIPIDQDGDTFKPMRAYFANPLGDEETGYLSIPTFITFPSLKDKQWSKSHPNKLSCQMLMMADYSWFESYKKEIDEAIQSRDEIRWKNAIKALELYKEAWKLRAKQLILDYFPVLSNHIDVFDISTPLAIENYLSAERGAAVGIDVTPKRFIDPVIRDHLDPVTKCPDLYLTGQDIVLCGATLCQLAGVITAFRMEGFWSSLKILKEAIIAGL